MIYPGFILLPLYIYPLLNQNLWKPLFDCAAKYPTLSFLVVVNVDSGPGGSACPGTEYVSAIHNLSLYSNIIPLGYVHTAARYNCGTGQDICPATQSQAVLQANITKYEKWSATTAAGGCGSPYIQVKGIFFDEAPTAATSVTYVQDIATFARNTLTHGKTIVYNPGSPVDAGYWNSADYINVFEGTEASYRQVKIPNLVGAHKSNATIIINNYTSNAETEENDVDTIIDSDLDGLAGVYITDRLYSAFPTRWSWLCEWVDAAN